MASLQSGLVIAVGLAILVVVGQSTTVNEEDSGCMRQWLMMAGATRSDLDGLENKARSLHLSEPQIRNTYPAPVLKALLPSSVASKLKTCTKNASLCGRQSPCHAGQCIYNRTSNSHVCMCPAGLLGNFCETDIDECSRGLHNCDIPERAVCNNTHGSYLCHCRHGYCGEDGRLCEDVDECEKATHSCHSNSTCINTVGSFNCSCVDGFEGDGFVCQEIVCTEKNSQSKLCRQVESNRQQLNILPQHEKKLKDLEKALDQTRETVVFLSRALREVRDLQTEILSQEPGCHGIAAWRYYPWMNWADRRESGQLKSVMYTKQRNDTLLHVTFHSQFWQQSNAKCSEYFIKFDGQECTSPAPIVTSLYKNTHSSSYVGVAPPSEVSGFCNSTSQGQLQSGTLSISVHIHDACSGGAAHTGKVVAGRVTSYLLVEEYCV